jgi:hypothetical protein
MRTPAMTLLTLILLTPLLSAQTPSAIVTTNAPIFLQPTSQTPLRVAALGTTLKVLKEDGDWTQVEFQDPQWGPRIGWVQTKLIEISRPELRPMDLSVRQATPDQSQPIAASPAPSADSTARHTREGAWFNIGLGLGSLGCENCDIRWNGVSGGLSVGTAVTDKFMFGVGTTGYSGTVDGDLLTTGTLDARLRYYFTRTGGGHLNFGIGVGTLTYAGDTDVGLGLMFGLGCDIRIGRNVSLTPFWNGFAMSNSVVDANVGQLGIGFTWH